MKIATWSDNAIEFTDGSRITYWHDHDCCERNWADFSVLEVFYNGEEFVDYRIEPVEGAGFNLVLSAKYTWEDKRIFIPCYSDQNGCYTDAIVIRVENKPFVDYPISAEMRLNC